MIWTYVGPKLQEPLFPHWPYFDYPQDRRISVTLVVQCNYVQLQEALLDSAHLTILHQDSFKRASDIDFVANVSSVTVAADPKVEAEHTNFGFNYVALRPTQTDEGLKTMARVTSFVAPFHLLNANGDFVGMIVPIDDHRTLHHFVWWSDSKDIADEPHRSRTCVTSGWIKRHCTSADCILRLGTRQASRIGSTTTFRIASPCVRARGEDCMISFPRMRPFSARAAPFAIGARRCCRRATWRLRGSTRPSWPSRRVQDG